MNQLIMPAKRSSPQLAGGELRNQTAIRRVIPALWRSRGTGVRKWRRLVLPATFTLSAAIAITMPHAVAAVIVSIIVGALVTIIGEYLYLYPRNTRADSIADIRRAVIERKLSASVAVKLIQADMQAPDGPHQQEGDMAGGRTRPSSRQDAGRSADP